MTLTLDPTVDALYIHLHAGDIAQTVEFEDDIYLDVDHAGRVLGVEMLGVKALSDFLMRHDGRLEIPDRIELDR
ncbi:MAG: DUF2283 domain-containing protein [Trueperaceae bacterium]|nr:DUF2283 domain-containing protein [Trueperaceae bacterium]